MACIMGQGWLHLCLSEGSITKYTMTRSSLRVPFVPGAGLIIATSCFTQKHNVTNILFACVIHYAFVLHTHKWRLFAFGFVAN